MGTEPAPQESIADAPLMPDARPTFMESVFSVLQRQEQAEPETEKKDSKLKPAKKAKKQGIGRAIAEALKREPEAESPLAPEEVISLHEVPPDVPPPLSQEMFYRRPPELPGAEMISPSETAPETEEQAEQPLEADYEKSHEIKGENAAQAATQVASVGQALVDLHQQASQAHELFSQSRQAPSTGLRDKLRNPLAALRALPPLYQRATIGGFALGLFIALLLALNASR